VAPEDDFGLVDVEAGVVNGTQTGRSADGAINVGYRSTRTADDVVVVVADPRLVPGNRASRLDAAQQSGLREGAQRVVDRLVRNRAHYRSGSSDKGLGVSMRVRVHRCQDRKPRLGHSQLRSAEHRLEVLKHGHFMRLAHYLEQIKKRLRVRDHETSRTMCLAPLPARGRPLEGACLPTRQLDRERHAAVTVVDVVALDRHGRDRVRDLEAGLRPSEWLLVGVVVGELVLTENVTLGG